MNNLSAYMRSDRPFVIAEIGNNHEGDVGVARDLIFAAKDAGVDAVKFQAIVPKSLVSMDQEKRIKQLDKFCFDLSDFEELSELSKKLNMNFFTSVFDINLIFELTKIQNIFKISSGDNTYKDLIESVISTNYPTIISTGGLHLNEIDVLRNHVLSSQGNVVNLALLHCVSNYPTLPENAQLYMIELMRQRYPDTVIGYSDHTLGNSACYLAAGLGAKIIEKHFTMSHTFSDFRDHQLSADPKQMTELMKLLPEAYSFAGRQKSDLDRNDSPMTGVRRKAIAKRPISAGDSFSRDNIEWLRITEDKGVDNSDKLYGKSAVVNIAKGDVILSGNIKN